MAIAQESSTPPLDPEPDRRAELIDGLRALADFYDQHPEFPLPYNDGAVDLHTYCLGADEFTAHVRTLGGHREKSVTGNFFNVVRRFGPLAVELYTNRELVCTKIETGRLRTVTVETLPVEVEAKIAALRAEHAVVETVQEPEVEWECPPSVLDLDARARGLAGVADLREVAADARAEAAG